MSTADDKPNLPELVLAERTHLALPSLPHWIGAVVEYLRQKALLAGACHEARAGKVMVALHEALSNAMVHGNLEISSELKERGDNAFAETLARRIADPAYAERVVEVVIDCNQERCRWIITDEGKGFDVDAVLRRSESDDPEILLASGRGILIMRSFLNEVRWELGGRRLVLTLQRESGEEKRRRPRVPVHQSVHVAPILADGSVDWDAAYRAVARDVSADGVGLLQERLAQTERVLIGFPLEGKLAYIPAEVRHCRSQAGGATVELGCRFQPARAAGTSAAESEQIARVQAAIQALLEKHRAAVPKDDRRAHPRVIYTERIEVEIGEGERLVGFARDLSKGGIAFITTAPLPLQVSLVFLPQDRGPALRLRSQVVRCVKVHEGFYDVGARFLDVDKP